MVPASRVLPPPPQLGLLLALTARSWKNKIPRCSPLGSPVPSGSPKFMLQLAFEFRLAQREVTVAVRQGASKTLPVRVAGMLDGIWVAPGLPVPMHLIPFAREPVPLVVLKGVTPLHPALAPTCTE